jgi:REP element-mobilizing transposase RayT
MPYDPDIHHRRSIRLPCWDYAREAIYFVTVCTNRRRTILGRIGHGRMFRSPLGRIACDSWEWLGDQYRRVEIGDFVVMPNHVHGLIGLETDDEGGSRAAPTSAVRGRKPLGQLVGAFKTVSSKRMRAIEPALPSRVWQRGYYERVVRNEHELEAITAYIAANPQRWSHDAENPGMTGRPDDMPFDT